MYNSNELGKLSDRDLLAESRNFEAQLETSAASLGLTSADHLALKAVNDQFETQLNEWDAAQTQYATKSAAKDDGRKNTLGKLRSNRNKIYVNTDVSDAVLASVNMPPRDKVKSDLPELADTSFPIGWIDTVQLKHIIHFRDVNTPDTTRKPEGVRSCEIYRFIGDSPPPLEDFDFVADDTNTPYVCNYTSADVGKKAIYRLRWRSKDDSVGTWSQPVEATIND